MDAFNKLSLAQVERLALLSEELGEAQQAIGKILRHGYDSTNPDIASGTDNREDLCKEMGHVVAALSFLSTRGDIQMYTVRTYESEKMESVARYLHHQNIDNLKIEGE